MPDTMWLLTLEGVGDPAGEGRGGPDGGSAPRDSGGPTEFQRFAAAADLTEIKRLHVKGCTLILKDRTLQEEELRSRVAKSKYFASAEISSLQQPNEVNLTGFDMYLVLKKPIKK